MINFYRLSILFLLFFILAVAYNIKKNYQIQFEFYQNYSTQVSNKTVTKELLKSVKNLNSSVNINDLVIKNKIKDVTIITISNYGFINMTLNWILHLEELNFNKFIVFCFDTVLFDALKRNGYETRIAMVPRQWLDFDISVNPSSWETRDYNRITQSKTLIWHHLVKLGHHILFRLLFIY